MSNSSRDLRMAINRSPAASRAVLILGLAALVGLGGLAVWQSAAAAATALPVIVASAVGLIIAFRRRDK